VVAMKEVYIINDLNSDWQNRVNNFFLHYQLRHAIEACNAGTFVPTQTEKLSDTSSVDNLGGPNGEIAEALHPNDYEASISSRDELEVHSSAHETDPDETETEDESTRLR
jgi:hypothetical protein